MPNHKTKKTKKSKAKRALAKAARNNSEDKSNSENASSSEVKNNSEVKTNSEAATSWEATSSPADDSASASTFRDPVSAFGKRYPHILDQIFDHLLRADCRHWIPEPAPEETDEIGDPENRIQIALRDARLPAEESQFVPLMMPPRFGVVVLHPEVLRGTKQMVQFVQASKENAHSKFLVNKAWNKYLKGRIRRGKEPGHKIVRALLAASPSVDPEEPQEAAWELTAEVIVKNPARGWIIHRSIEMTDMAGVCPICLIMLRNAKGSSYYTVFRGMLLASFKFTGAGICFKADCPGVNFGALSQLIYVKKDSPRLEELRLEYNEVFGKLKENKNRVPAKFAKLTTLGTLQYNADPDIMQFERPVNMEYLETYLNL